jgi:hypothetical protein
MMTEIKKNNTNISVSIVSFSENTKSVFIFTSISLFLIIISTLLSHIYIINDTLNKGIKIFAVLTLLYALYINLKETNKLYNNVPTMFSNSELKGLRNNTLLSYGLCLMIFGLSSYILFTL